MNEFLNTEVETDPDISNEEINILARQAKAKVYKDIFTQLYKQRLYSGSHPAPTAISEAITEIKEFEDKTTPFGYFITVNPYETTTIERLQVLTEKAMNKKWINYYYYTFEQRSEDPLKPRGWHTHIYIRSFGKPRNEVRREFHSTFKQIIGNDLHLKIDRIKQSDELKVINYITGVKKDKEKWSKQEADRIIRQELGLQSYYHYSEGQNSSDSEDEDSTLPGEKSEKNPN